MIGPIFGTFGRMRVSTGKATQTDGRMFTVVVEGFGIGRQRRAERRLTVPFHQLQRLMQTIALKGGRIRMVSADEIRPGTAPAAAPPADATPTPAPARKAPVSHADVPVNLYKPKDPFIGTVTENYSLLAEGAIGRVNHITFDLSGGNPSTTWRARASASSPTAKTPTANPTSCASIRSPARATATTARTTPSRSASVSCSTRRTAPPSTGCAPPSSATSSPGAKVKITGPVGKEMLLPPDEDANVIMLATGTGIAPMRAYLRRMFEPAEREKNARVPVPRQGLADHGRAQDRQPALRGRLPALSERVPRELPLHQGHQPRTAERPAVGGCTSRTGSPSTPTRSSP